jgi:hypothetical protein
MRGFVSLCGAIAALVLLSACSSPSSPPPSVAASTVSNDETCKGWNELLAAARKDMPNPEGDELRASLRDEAGTAAATATGQLKADLQLLSDAPPAPNGNQPAQEVQDADVRISDTCQTMEYLGLETENPAPTSSSTSTPSATANAAGMNLKGQVKITDTDGYTYLLSYQAQANGFISDLTNAKPGFTDLSQASTLSASVQNTTKGRSAPGKGIEFNIWGLYPLSSLACTMDQKPSAVLRGTPTLIGAGATPEFCAIRLTTEFFNYTDSIPSQSTVDLQPNVGGPFKQVVKGVPEDQASAIKNALDSPRYKVALIWDQTVGLSFVQTPLTIEESCPVILTTDNGQRANEITAIPVEGGRAVCQP